MSVLGIAQVQTGLAAFLVLASARSGDLRTRLTRMGVVTLIGGAFGLLGYLSAGTAWQAALVLGVVSYLTGLAYGYGAAAGKAGFYLLGGRWPSRSGPPKASTLKQALPRSWSAASWRWP